MNMQKILVDVLARTYFANFKKGEVKLLPHFVLLKFFCITLYMRVPTAFCTRVTTVRAKSAIISPKIDHFMIALA